MQSASLSLFMRAGFDFPPAKSILPHYYPKCYYIVVTRIAALYVFFAFFGSKYKKEP